MQGLCVMKIDAPFEEYPFSASFAMAFNSACCTSGRVTSSPFTSISQQLS